MSHFTNKGWVLAGNKPVHLGNFDWSRDYPWRQIEITAVAKRIEVTLMNVNNEAARGGYWSCGHACRDFRLTWVDLNDLDSLPTFFTDEAPGVYEKFDSLVQPLRTNMAALRQALAA